jgi:Outer membrane protein beta-barrel domain
MFTRLHVWVAFAAFLIATAPAAAQSLKPPAAVEVLAGHAGFVDDGTIEHVVVFGGAARVYLTPRISLGPEITYMRGPGDDRDWFFLGNLTWDIRHPRAGRPPRVSPFMVVGAGFFTHSAGVGTGTFTSSEGAFAAGGGTRVYITDRVYAMGDFRIGWELHYRITGGIGVSM